MHQEPTESSTPAYITYYENVLRFSSVMMAIDVSRIQDKAVHFFVSSPVVFKGEKEGHTVYPVKLAKEAVVEWQAVMLVTATEAYLLDALAYVAARDPRLMRDSGQTVTYEDVLSAESVEDLAAEMRQSWARGFVDKGGPRVWRQRLEKMGARGYNEAIEDHMETCWGIRHLIVHRAGVATRDFVRRHPHFGATPGTRISFRREQMIPFLEAISNFVETTERYLCARLAAELEKGAGGENDHRGVTR